jgi:hypothetical protein
MITKQSVVSSQLKHVEYNSETFVLTVTFMNDKRYEYYDVSKNDFNSLLDADSIGSHFIKNFRNKFGYQAI